MLAALLELKGWSLRWNQFLTFLGFPRFELVLRLLEALQAISGPSWCFWFWFLKVWCQRKMKSSFSPLAQQADQHLSMISPRELYFHPRHLLPGAVLEVAPPHHPPFRQALFALHQAYTYWIHLEVSASLKNPGLWSFLGFLLSFHLVQPLPRLLLWDHLHLRSLLLPRLHFGPLLILHLNLDYLLQTLFSYPWIISWVLAPYFEDWRIPKARLTIPMLLFALELVLHLLLI